MEIEYSEDNLPSEAHKRPLATGITDKDICDAYEQHGSVRKAAEAIGMSFESVRRRLKRHEVKDPAVKDAMSAIGTNLTPRMVYYKTHKTGDPTYTVLLKPDENEEQEDLTDHLVEVFSNLKPAPLVECASDPDKDLLTIYPIFDAHIGMRAWGQEVGEDWDSEIAVDYITKSIAKCIAQSPSSDTAIIINGGDMMHADSDNNETPRSKHKLDTDSRHYKTIDTVIQMSINMIEMAARKHKRVVYRALRGNHDEHSHTNITFALYYHYQNNPNIIIEKNPCDFFVYEFGKTMIAAHHGDKAKPQNLVLHAADEWPEMWGRTRYRYYYIGHQHHKQFHDIGGMSVEMLRASTKKDSYSHSHAYCGRSELRAITYHREHGESGRVVVNY
jgi:hypothetical protein